MCRFIGRGRVEWEKRETKRERKSRRERIEGLYPCPATDGEKVCYLACVARPAGDRWQLAAARSNLPQSESH